MTSLNQRLETAKLKRKNARNALEKGFTLVELMIVIVIVGILSAVALPNFLSQTEKAKATEAKTKMSAIVKQGHAEWQEEGQTTEAQALALSERGGRFTYACTQTTTDSGRNQDGLTTIDGEDAFLCASLSIPESEGGDASLEDKAAWACVNLETGVTDVSSQLSDTTETDAADLVVSWPAVGVDDIDCASIS